MRITTNQVLRNYQTNLTKSTASLEAARNRVISNRNFSKASENPAATAKAYKLRKEFSENADYMENVKNTISHFDAVEGSAMQMSRITNEANALVLEGLTGTSSFESRQTLATSLRKMQESLVLAANSKLGDTFLFGGQTTDSVPVELKNGKMMYLGLDVGSDDPAVQQQLAAMEGEEIMVDLGFGLSFDDNGDVVNNSAFNTAFSALSFLGYGKNDDGTDKNIVNILGEMATELEKEKPDQDKLDSLSKHFTDSRNDLLDEVTVLGTKSNFLTTTQTRLDENRVTLNTKMVALENVDLANAITDYSWAQFAYNAALKVGNSILSPSFIDFMS